MRNLANLALVVVLVLSLEASAPVPFPVQDNPYDLRIGTITDTHIGFGGPIALIAMALRQLNQEADIVIDTGDSKEHPQSSTSEPDPYEFNLYSSLIKNNLTCPFKAVPGNHESPVLFAQYFGDSNWILDIEGYRLVGLDTRTRIVNLAFLAEALKSGRPTIIFAHHPTYLLLNKEEVLQILKNNNFLAWVHGHHHLQWTWENPKGILLVQGGWGLLGQYQLICLKDGKIAKIVFR